MAWHNVVQCTIYGSGKIALIRKLSFFDFIYLKATNCPNQIQFSFSMTCLVFKINYIVWGRKHIFSPPVVSCQIKLGFLISNNKCVHQWMLQIFKVFKVWNISAILVKRIDMSYKENWIWNGLDILHEYWLVYSIKHQGKPLLRPKHLV